MNKYLFVSLLFALLPIAGMAQQKQSASLDSIAKSMSYIQQRTSISLYFLTKRMLVNGTYNGAQGAVSVGSEESY